MSVHMRKPSCRSSSAPIMHISVMPKTSKTVAPHMLSILARLAADSGSAQHRIFSTEEFFRSKPAASARFARWSA